MEDPQISRHNERFEQNNNNAVAEEEEGAVSNFWYEKHEKCDELSEIKWTEEEYDRDPHREFFYDAYRSETTTPELDNSVENAEEIKDERKPLALMDDWELWDYMEEDELKKRLKNYPELFEQITRKRKRKAAFDDGDDEDLCAVMERHAKVTKFGEHTTVY
ncbi:uncharacterized protein LOC129777335 [Toxorhynchites rutilus septentrionalis]|uniref:uncharacterized protein LOC129777335 n=1 Tax=Toxorhynchites rutilus septentrionalis TaxID=329112 RepID=UPI002478970F|nr:uncharacterized protein LOC129777335 [Toxorhynchites rutilus septentrionalis]XP_055639539.1 uncharacterized protein LOC129777335 [Toxorhynchites rutilus septentrionalis]